MGRGRHTIRIEACNGIFAAPARGSSMKKKHEFSSHFDAIRTLKCAKIRVSESGCLAALARQGGVALLHLFRDAGFL